MEKILTVLVDDEGTVLVNDANNRQIAQIDTDFAHPLGCEVTGGLVGALTKEAVRHHLAEVADATEAILRDAGIRPPGL